MQVLVTRRRRGVFCFMAEEITLRVKEQHFYLAQAKARLLTPFAAIEAEAEAMEQECLDNPPECFDPEQWDMSMVYEAAFHRSLEHYDLLQGSTPFSRTLTRRPIQAMRSVHVKAS
ncbi:hypothetical protein [Stenotrophomonas maltophilia]|uniref:hypothetical protein n=2 Tax=Stenotrophomonas maltophilia TaxID=40324 RepID=UPI00066B80B4|nr:hypothetical protein [Stenotrophomonas maltophilia]